MEIFFLIGGLCTRKYAEHNFLLVAFKKLYFARTKEQGYFEKSKKTEQLVTNENDYHCLSKLGPRYLYLGSNPLVSLGFLACVPAFQAVMPIVLSIYT